MTGLLMVLAISPAYAQNEDNTAFGVVDQTGLEDVYKVSEFDEIMFQLPSGMRIERGSEYKALMPDGTFGVSIQKVNYPSTKKIAFELCKRLADSMGLPRTLVKKQNYGKAKGAQAMGLVDGKYAACVVLVFDDHQLQVVALADPSQLETLKRFLESIKK